MKKINTNINIGILFSKPQHPKTGDVYWDAKALSLFSYDGTHWSRIQAETTDNISFKLSANYEITDTDILEINNI